MAAGIESCVCATALQPYNYQRSLPSIILIITHRDRSSCDYRLLHILLCAIMSGLHIVHSLARGFDLAMDQLHSKLVSRRQSIVGTRPASLFLAGYVVPSCHSSEPLCNPTKNAKQAMLHMALTSTLHVRLHFKLQNGKWWSSSAVWATYDYREL